MEGLPDMASDVLTNELGLAPGLIKMGKKL
jgi:hypothetical protein